MEYNCIGKTVKYLLLDYPRVLRPAKPDTTNVAAARPTGIEAPASSPGHNDHWSSRWAPRICADLPADGVSHHGLSGAVSLSGVRERGFDPRYPVGLRELSV